MFRKLIKNKKAQNTAEYAILISLVVAGIIAMQTYAQRALQGRVRDASQFLITATSNLGNTVQYEPYYLTTQYDTLRNDVKSQLLSNVTTSAREDSTSTRFGGGFQESDYNTGLSGVQGGL